MWWDRAVVLGLATAAMVFNTGQSDYCFFAHLSSDPGLEPTGAVLGDIVEVCYAFKDGYAQVTYTLTPNGSGAAWVAASQPPFLLQHGPVPDDCIHSTGSQGEENPSTGMVSVPVTIQAHRITLDDDAKPRANAATPAPEYPVDSEPAYVQNLPFPPLVPASAAQNLRLNCDSTQSYYTVNHGSGTVTHFGLCPFHKIVSIPVADSPLELALTPDAKFLLVTSFSGPVSFIDTSTDQVVATVSSPGAHPSGIAISPDGTRAYVTSFAIPGALLLIDVVNRQITGSIALPGYARNVFLTPDGSEAWVNYLANNQISIIDTLTETVAYSFSLNAVAEAGLAFNPTGTRAYIATRAGTIAVIDTATLDSIANIPVGAWPVDVTVTPDGERVLVDDFSSSGTLVAINPTNNTVISTLNTGAPITGLFLYPRVP